MPSDRDDLTAARLAGLHLPPAAGGWVPEQPWFANEALPVQASRPVPRGSGPQHARVGPTGAPVLEAIADRLPWLRELTATPSGRALLSLAGVCAACLAVTAWVLLHRPAAPASYPPVTATLPPLVATTPPGIIVDVGGRVRHPGLVTLSPGARVADALEAAGGALRSRDIARVDLAALVNDGELILIGLAGAQAGAPAGTGGAGDSDGPVDLNTATVDQLDELPGIGPVLAQRILDWRTDNGGFHAVEDLDEVSGIGPSLLAELTPLVRV